MASRLREAVTLAAELVRLRRGRPLPPGRPATYIATASTRGLKQSPSIRRQRDPKQVDRALWTKGRLPRATTRASTIELHIQHNAVPQPSSCISNTMRVKSSSSSRVGLPVHSASLSSR